MTDLDALRALSEYHYGVIPGTHDAKCWGCQVLAVASKALDEVEALREVRDAAGRVVEDWLRTEPGECPALSRGLGGLRQALDRARGV